MWGEGGDRDLVGQVSQLILAEIVAASSPVARANSQQLALRTRYQFPALVLRTSSRSRTSLCYHRKAWGGGRITSSSL